MLMDPVRAVLAACGVLLALLGFIFLDAPIPMMLAVLMILRFLVTPHRSLQAVGGVFAVITLVAFGVNRPNHGHDLLRDFVAYGALVLMVLPMLHLLVMRRISAKSTAR